MEPRVAVLFRHKLIEKRLTQESLLSNGMSQDYPSYRETVGLIRGLDGAMVLLEEAIKEAAEGK